MNQNEVKKDDYILSPEEEAKIEEEARREVEEFVRLDEERALRESSIGKFLEESLNFVSLLTLR